MSKFHYFILINTLLLLLYSGISLYHNVFMVGIVIAYLLVCSGIIAIGATKIELNFFLTSWNKNPYKKQVALTFDDGPDPELTTEVLALLKKHDCKATFFCIGKKVKEQHEIIKNINDEGHELGNHTWSHSNFFDIYPTKKVVEELQNTSDELTKVTGKNHFLFRPPYGVTNPHIGNAIKKLNLQSVGWSVRSFDTVAKDKTALIEKVTLKIKPGDVILLHDTKKVTVEALEDLIQDIKQKGLKMVTVSELFDNTSLQ